MISHHWCRTRSPADKNDISSSWSKCWFNHSSPNW